MLHAQLSFEFFPALDEGFINIEVELPQGYNLDQTAKMLDEMEKIIAENREVKSYSNSNG